MRIKKSGAILRLVSLVILFSLGLKPVQAADDHKGTEFVLGFMEGNTTTVKILFITGDTATTGVVEVPGLAFSEAFSVTPGSTTSVRLPNDLEVIGSDFVGNNGVLVSAIDEVAVYGLNQITFSTDAFLGLPTDILGTEYIVAGYQQNLNGNSQFAVVGTEDNTTVTITPNVTTGSRIAGVPFEIILNRLEVYQLQSDDLDEDLTGTSIDSDKPITLFGGNKCALIPVDAVACDHIVEQIPPIDIWGTTFLTTPLANRFQVIFFVC